MKLTFLTVWKDVGRRPVGISATFKITDPKFTIARANFVPSPCQIELPALWQGRAVPYVEGWGANATLSRNRPREPSGGWEARCLVRFLNEIILQCGRRRGIYAGSNYQRAVVLLCWGAAIVWDIYFYRQFNWGLPANLSLGIWLLSVLESLGEAAIKVEDRLLSKGDWERSQRETIQLTMVVWRLIWSVDVDV